MPAISPAINIGIGKYGAICLNNLGANFALRESKYADYVSFHQLNQVDGIISMHNFDFQSESFKELKFSAENIPDLQAWQLHSFISQAYNNLISLTNRLHLNVNFNSIHINLIFGAFETEHLELVKETILLIDKLRRQGDFGQVKVKCFSILSDGNGVPTPIQEENIVQTLDAIVEIRNNYNILSHNFILDDKNTHAVALNAKNNYLAFAISEIIVALIRNEYKMLGSLPNRIGTVSIGIGMVYFDIHYFTAFVKNRILKSKIEIEKLDGKKSKISISEYTSLVQEVLLPYVEGKEEVDFVIKNIQDVVVPEDFENTLGCYEFLLANILGEYDRVPLVEPIEANELYSINDLIYHLLYHQVIPDNTKKDKGLLSLKDYKNNRTEYNAKLRDKIDASDFEMLEEHQVLVKHNEEVEKLINYYANPTWRKRIMPIHSAESLVKEIEQAKSVQNKEKEKFNKKGFIRRFFGRRKYAEQKKASEELIKNLENEKATCSGIKIKLESDLDKLYELKKKIKSLLNKLDIGIKDIHSMSKVYQKKMDSLPYLDFEFIQNIISAEKLAAYEAKHKEELQSNIKETLKILFTETIKKEKSFINLIDKKISQSTNSIINFKMTHHLLNEYDQMDLLKPFDFHSDIKKLKHSSLPFFNAIPTYSYQSHYLKYYDDSDRVRTIDLDVLLKENYSGSLPTTIHAANPDKFALITVEVVEDLKSIVKYNNHYMRSNFNKKDV